jgi:hypothetical protein
LTRWVSFPHVRVPEPLFNPQDVRLAEQLFTATTSHTPDPGRCGWMPGALVNLKDCCRPGVKKSAAA